MVTVENWRPIPGWEGLYEASDLGRIRSLSRTRLGRNGHPQPMRGRVLRPAVKADHYAYVHLSHNGQKCTRPVHRLVLAAFMGPAPAGKESAHNDGDRMNNRLSNLRYATHLENVADRILHGTENRGVRHHNARLTESDVRLIRARIRAGEKSAAIAVDFNIQPPTVRGIASGHRWAWLTDDEIEAA